MRGPGMCCRRKRIQDSVAFRKGWPAGAVARSAARALGHESLAKHGVGPSDGFGEQRGGGMSVTRATIATCDTDPPCSRPDDHQLAVVERDHVGGAGEASRGPCRTGHRPDGSPFGRLAPGIICGHGR
jgi:hypothetical protein